MEFADSNRVCGEREVCTNRCVIVGSLWAIVGREGERESERERERQRERGRQREGEGEEEEEGGEGGAYCGH